MPPSGCAASPSRALMRSERDDIRVENRTGMSSRTSRGVVTTMHLVIPRSDDQGNQTIPLNVCPLRTDSSCSHPRAEAVLMAVRYVLSLMRFNERARISRAARRLARTVSAQAQPEAGEAIRRVAARANHRVITRPKVGVIRLVFSNAANGPTPTAGRTRR